MVSDVNGEVFLMFANNYFLQLIYHLYFQNFEKCSVKVLYQNVIYPCKQWEVLDYSRTIVIVT